MPHEGRCDVSVLINVDVPDLERAIAFYANAFGLAVGRRFGAGSVHEPGVGGGPPAVERVVQMLDDIGFQPELAADGSGAVEIRLRRCPFHELARDSEGVVCAIHLGLIRGALQQLGSPGAAVRLVPFVTPTLCVVQIGPPPGSPATRRPGDPQVE